MVDITDQVMEDAGVVIASCAHALARDFHGYVTAQDMSQEMWVWVLKHDRKVNEWLDREDRGEKNRGAKALSKSLLRMGQAFCRREKAKACGYLPQDEYFYSRSLVAALVEAMVNDGKMQVNLVDDTPRKTKLDSEGNDILALLADISEAMEILDGNQKDLVVRICGYGDSAATVAEEEGVTRQAVENRLNRALDRMIKELGGEYPY